MNYKPETTTNVYDGITYPFLISPNHEIKNKDIPINTIINWGDDELKIISKNNCSCCYFFKKGHVCQQPRMRLYCAKYKRKDNTSIIFLKV